MISSPSLVLWLILSTLYAAAFHILVGQNWRELFTSWLAALVGFLCGQLLAVLVGWPDIVIGQIRLVSSFAGSLLSVFLARRLRL
jgi:uncharacterized membrane protein YjjP (DUF1212 family)